MKEMKLSKLDLIQKVELIRMTLSLAAIFLWQPYQIRDIYIIQIRHVIIDSNDIFFPKMDPAPGDNKPLHRKPPRFTSV